MLWVVVGLLLLNLHDLSAEVVIEVAPGDQAVVFGQDLLLPCTVKNLITGTRDGLTILWKHNELDVQSKASLFSNGTLLIPFLDNGDLGNYTCSVYDSNSTLILTSHPANIFHAYIKMFEVSPTPVNTLEDEMVSFDCITGESAPPPEIFWERDGEPFTGGEQYSATYGGYSDNALVVQYSMKLMLRAKPHLDGSYNCVARNPALKIDVRSRRVLMQTAEMESPPYIRDDLIRSDVIVALNQQMLIGCPISGKPDVTVTWFKDGNPLDQLGDFYTLMNGSLHRPHTQKSDSGNYMCEGTNPLGFIRSPNITVTIASIEIDFGHHPDDLYVVAGLPATLKCAPPISVPTANVTWYKDNAMLVPRTGSQALQVVKTVEGFWNVQFKEIQKQDEGEYFCVATNDYAVPQSRTSQTASISVGGAPIFVEPPVGLTVEKGKLAQLTCYVQGDPFPEITWLFENEIITVSETVSFRQGNQELWIGNVNKGDEGTYTCRAVNRYNTIQTRVYLKVLVPPVVTEPVGHTVASKGDAVIIPCGVYSDPQPTVTWYKDSAGVTMGDRFTQLPNGLYITSVQVEDAGTYLCHAANIAGDTEDEGRLEVLVKPHFIKEPQDHVVNLGRNVTFTCSVNGFPKPTLRWTFNDSSLFPQDTLLSLSGEQLVLREVGWNHVGRYACIAESEEGRKKSEATLSIRIPPEVTSIDGIPLLYQGEDILLTCHVTGIPKPDVEWFFQRQPVAPSQDGRISIPEPNMLNVKFVTLNDAGVYTCKGINAAGVSQEDVQVFIITRPSPPVLHQAMTMSATSVKLSWSIEQRQPQTPVDHVIIQYRKQIETGSPYKKEEVLHLAEYIVDDLDPASTYVFMVSAVNSAGTSDISNPLTAHTFDAGPSEPRNLQMREINAYNITVGWEIPETTNGDIKKYQLVYRETDQIQESTIIINSNNNAYHSHVIPDLLPYSWYTVRVRGATMEGDQVLWGNWSDTLEIRTTQAVPSGAPRDIRAEALSSYMVHVKWEAVAQPDQNGPIKRYYVNFWLLSNLSKPIDDQVIDNLDLQANISDLEPWTWYMVKITPENAAGPGEASQPITVRTLPAAPGSSPLDLTAVGQSATSILVKWKLPPHADWNSDISGFIIQYWQHEHTNISEVISKGVLDLAADIRNLAVYTDYNLRVAAYTDQIEDGIGPFTDNITVRTLQSEPGPVTDLTYKASSSSIYLSWKPPEVTNGVITHYLVFYHLIGPSVLTTPTTISQPIIAEHIPILLKNSLLLNNIFHNIGRNLTEGLLFPLTNVCDIILQNATVFEEVENVTSVIQLKSLTLFSNLSNETVFDWMKSEQVPLGMLCINLQSALVDFLYKEDQPIVPQVFNVTVSKPAARLENLQSAYIYGISVLAATVAGPGPNITIQATTLEAQTTTTTTTVRPLPPLTNPSDDGISLAEKEVDKELLNLPVIIGGGVSGFILLLIILLIGGCLCMRRRRSMSDEKTKVVANETLEDTNANSMYGELDRPSTLAAVATAAEDGTDSVDIYGDGVRFHSPQHQYDQSTDRSFMTDESGQIVSQGQRIKEAFLGMDNPSYSGLAAPGTIKSNPAYYEEPSSSDLESMTVTMAFSTEDDLSAKAGESTLKRKSKMKSADAAAIARLRSSTLPPGLVDNDRSYLINNETQVVYNERTAL